MAENKPVPKRRATKRTEPRALFRFIEELSWLLSSYDNLDYKALSNLAHEYETAIKFRNSIAHQRVSQFDDPLVGVLPALLVDETLFPSNEDIAEFAEGLLSIEIPRWNKKSKYELIGHIVCHTNMAPPARREDLVLAIRNLLDDKTVNKNEARRRRKSGASWNEVIQVLSAQ